MNSYIFKCTVILGTASIILYNQMPKDMHASEAVVQMEATLRKYTTEIHLKVIYKTKSYSVTVLK